ncbi:MAG: helix-turn-helix domain-containing protein [Terricaulis sp.]
MKRTKKHIRARQSPPINQMELFGESLSPSKPAATRPSPSPPKTSKFRMPPTTLAPPIGALLDVRQAAARLGLSKSTLDKMRCRGVGPKFVKSTDRAVRYDPKDLDSWVEKRRRQSTGQGE